MDISQLTDDQLNRAMIWLNPPSKGIYTDDEFGALENKRGGWKLISYLSDWSLTGPLQIEHDCALMPRAGDPRGPIAQICVKSNNKPPFYEENSGYRYFESNNTNPLRAVCECIVMYHQAKRT